MAFKRVIIRRVGPLSWLLDAMKKIKQNPASKVPNNSQMPPQPAKSLDAEFFAAYIEHANILRSWLVAYGVGGPVLILSQEHVWARMSDAGSLRLVAILFLAGVSLQVFLAALNKSVMWACYFGETSKVFKDTRRYKCADWLSERYSIDLFFDFSTVILFALATYFCLISLAG